MLSVFTVVCRTCLMRLSYRFLRLVKHFRWYFASIAMRSPPTILASSVISCSLLIIVLRLASISYVETSWRSHSSVHFSHKRPCLIMVIVRCLIPCQHCSPSSGFDFFCFLALASLSLLNFKWHDLCHKSELFTRSSTFRLPWNLSSTGSWSIAPNSLTIIKNNWYVDVLSALCPGLRSGHFNCSSVSCWQIIQPLMSYHHFNFHIGFRMPFWKWITYVGHLVWNWLHWPQKPMIWYFICVNVTSTARYIWHFSFAGSHFGLWLPFWKIIKFKMAPRLKSMGLHTKFGTFIHQVILHLKIVAKPPD